MQDGLAAAGGASNGRGQIAANPTRIDIHRQHFTDHNSKRGNARIRLLNHWNIQFLQLEVTGLSPGVLRLEYGDPDWSPHDNIRLADSEPVLIDEPEPLTMPERHLADDAQPQSTGEVFFVLEPSGLSATRPRLGYIRRPRAGIG